MGATGDPQKKTAKQRGYYTPADAAAFLRERDASRTAWTMLATLFVSEVIAFITFAAPGWAKTLEVHTYSTFEGAMHGYYGMWFSCWSLSDDFWSDTRTDCELMLDLQKLPFWWKICQGLAICQLILGVSALSVCGCYCCSKYVAKKISALVAIIVLVVIEGVLTVALFTVWCVLFLNSVYWCCPSGAMQMLEWRLHYCFVLACVLPAFLIAIVIMAATEIHVLRSPLRLEKYQHKVASTRRQVEGPYREMQVGPDMMTYHPGVQESFRASTYQPRPQQTQPPRPSLTQPQEQKDPDRPLELELEQRPPPDGLDAKEPLGPDELDLTKELAY